MWTRISLCFGNKSEIMAHHFQIKVVIVTITFFRTVSLKGILSANGLMKRNELVIHRMITKQFS